MPMVRIGSSAPRSRTKSNRSLPTSGSRHATQNVAHLVLDRVDPLRGERPRHQRTVDGVQRRILVDEHARRHDGIGLDHLEDVALGRAEPLRVPQRRVDVGVAAQAPEVVALVVVERRLVAQPLVGRVGVDVDLDVLRVVVQVAQRLSSAHLYERRAYAVRSYSR